MKVLNLYAGIGGNRKLWTDVEVTAIEINPEIAKIYQDFFPNDIVIIADAHQYLLDHFDEFDFVWSSPPCPTHSKLQSMIIHNTNKIVYPEMSLYQEIIVFKEWFRGLFIVENVQGYYEPLIMPSIKLHRHFYWSNFKITNFKVTDNRKHTEIKNNSTVYGFNIYDKKVNYDKSKILRNMVDPELGLHILNCALKKYDYNKQTQQTLFDNI